MMRASLACALGAAALSPLAAQQPTFSARRESVRVDVLVTDRGRPVRDLKRADFEILDSGVPQDIDLVSFEQLPLTVVLALDISASISGERLDHLREGGRAVLANLKSADRSALLTFADAVALRTRPTSEVAAVRAALDGMQPPRQEGGGTALVDACFTAMMLPDADTGRGLLIAFTDGVDTSSWLPPDRVLQAARRSNLVAYAVSTARLPRGSFLRELSDETGGGAIEIGSSAELGATFLGILDEFRQRYLVSYSPVNVPGDGWHPLTVRVKGRKVDVKARAGYVKN